MTQHFSRRDVLATTAATATAAVAGCLGIGPGSDEPEEMASTDVENAGELGTPADSFTVLVRSQPFPEFDPQIIHVTPGATVEWLVETGRHDVVAYHEDIHPPHRTPHGVDAWESPRLNGPGSSYERTFETEGVYDYVDRQEVCISHEIAGNVGRVVVGWPHPNDEPAMQPLSEEEETALPIRVRNAFDMFDEKTRPVLEAGPE